MTSFRALDVMHGRRRVGTLSEAAGLWQLEYAPEWLEAEGSFDLSPALPRASSPIVDGASQRPVQWFFDNLLPEEGARTLLAREASLSGEDSFALLGHYGAESAGALTLLAPGAPQPTSGLRPLDDASLHDRIARLPRQSLAAEAPKHMSLAGAQHKLAVTVRDGSLFEPEGSTPSTHILKPDHRDTAHFPHSVANEWFVMQLAARTGLQIPPVSLRQVPDPVYLIERFDRITSPPDLTERLHAIDACQLLGLDRQFKYRAANVDALLRCTQACRSRAITRQRLYRWLLFNLLTGNHDAHLKNLSFLVDSSGISLAPHYDLLCTVLYGHASDDPGHWPGAELPLTLEGARTFGELRRDHVVAIGVELGLGRAASERILDQMLVDLPRHAAALYRQLEADANHGHAPTLHAGELRFLRQINHLVIAGMTVALSGD